MKVCVSFPVGCPRAEFDAYLALEYLKANNCVITQDFSAADLILISGCAVTKSAEDQSKLFLSIAAHKKKSNAHLVVFGCFPGILKDVVEHDYNGNAIQERNFTILDDIIKSHIKYANFNKIGISFKGNLNNFSNYNKIKARFKSTDNVLWDYIGLLSNYFYKNLRYNLINPGIGSYNVRISKGCNGACTYCGIRQANGPLISNNLDDIIETLKRAVSSGHSKVRLIAEDVGAYGQDCGINISTLLKKIFSIHGAFQIVIDDFSPRWLISYFHELMEIFSQNPDRLASICFPIQSGSNKILKLMRRGYDADYAKKYIGIFRRNFSNLLINTHILLGFPGETMDDFNKTLDFLKADFFNISSIYKYSDRQGIISSSFAYKNSEFIKLIRLIKLIQTIPIKKLSIVTSTVK